MEALDSSCLARRCVLTSVLAGAAIELSGCSRYGDQQPTPSAIATAPDSATGGSASAKTGGSAPAAAGTKATAAAAPALASLAQVPVGGGKVLAAQGVVLTQPVAGTVKAFSVICTHAGCKVAEVAGGTINCPCHGSKFAIADGSVVGGPAPRPLASIAVAVRGDGIVRI